MSEEVRRSAVIVAAGVGQRFGGDKLMLTLSGRTVLEWSVAAFAGLVDELVVVANQQKMATYKQLLTEKFPGLPLVFVTGGRERWESSYLGIQATSGELVAIHDAARPLIEPRLIEESFQAAARTGAAVVAAPATDSIKVMDEAGDNVSALDRRTIYLAQTPQTFKRAVILRAYQLAREQAYQQMTDESELVTRFLRQKVAVVAASNRNLKITFPQDVKLAQALMTEVDKK